MTGLDQPRINQTGNTDQAEDIAKKIKSTIKEAIGTVTGDKKTEVEGEAEQVECAVQKEWAI